MKTFLIISSILSAYASSLSCLDDNYSTNGGIGSSLCGPTSNPYRSEDIESIRCGDGGYVTCVAHSLDSSGYLETFQFACSDGYESEIFGPVSSHGDIGELKCAEGGIQAIFGYQDEDRYPLDSYITCTNTADCGFVGFDSDGDRLIVDGWGDYMDHQDEYRGSCQYNTYTSGFIIRSTDGDIRRLSLVCTPEDDCPQTGLTLPYSTNEYEQGLVDSGDEYSVDESSTDESFGESSGFSSVSYSSVCVLVSLLVVIVANMD